MDLTRVDIKIDCHNSKASEIITLIKAAIAKSGLPMTVEVKRVPISRDLNRSNVIVKGNAFNFTGVKILRDAAKEARFA